MQSYPHTSFACALVAAALLFGWQPTPGYGSVLDWDDESYTAGATSQNYVVDGVNINVAVTWDNDYSATLFGFIPVTRTENPFELASGGPTSPSIDNVFTGGMGGGTESLTLLVGSTTYTTGGWYSRTLVEGFADRDSTVTITVSFSTMVTEVDFSIFDIDYNANDFQDLIMVSASDGVNTYLPTTTNEANAVNTILSPGVVRGFAGNTDSSARGNAYFDFGGNEFNSISITYGNGPSAPNAPDGQGVALHNINFTAVPEAEAAWALVPLAGIVGFTTWQRHRRRTA